jgi:hypothetical protein
MKTNFRDLFTKERFQQELAEEISKDLKGKTNALANNNLNNNNRHN